MDKDAAAKREDAAVKKEDALVHSIYSDVRNDKPEEARISLMEEYLSRTEKEVIAFVKLVSQMEASSLATVN